jgi:NAD(P)-dependent dehydrogenase (short-subunit alcohol dehydrogenase family)
VLVTGANRGPRAGAGRRSPEQGVERVDAASRQQITHSHKPVTPVALGFTNAAQIQATVEVVESLDVLINNAGIALSTTSATARTR